MQAVCIIAFYWSEVGFLEDCPRRPHALIPPLRAHTAQAPEDQSWKPRIIQMCSSSSEYCGELSLGMLGWLPNTIL